MYPMSKMNLSGWHVNGCHSMHVSHTYMSGPHLHMSGYLQYVFKEICLMKPG